MCFARFKSIYSDPFSRIIPPENRRSFEAPGSPAIVGSPRAFHRSDIKETGALKGPSKLPKLGECTNIFGRPTIRDVRGVTTF